MYFGEIGIIVFVKVKLSFEEEVYLKKERNFLGSLGGFLVLKGFKVIILKLLKTIVVIGLFMLIF